MKKKLYILIGGLIVLGVIGGVLIHTSTFFSGRVSMTFDRKPAEASATDSLGHPKAKNGEKVLVAYFSWGGNTRKVARHIHDRIGGDIYEIRTVKTYPDDYKACVEDAKMEIETNARPELSGNLPDLKNYDTLFLGYPVWWYAAPRPVMTFIDHYNFDGKEVILFCTSGGSSLSETDREIMEYPAMQGANFGEGLTANIEGDIDPWLARAGF